jgi:hypothetical protein
MYARLIIEKGAEINGRTDRFGTGDAGVLQSEFGLIT